MCKCVRQGSTTKLRVPQWDDHIAWDRAWEVKGFLSASQPPWRCATRGCSQQWYHWWCKRNSPPDETADSGEAAHQYANIIRQEVYQKFGTWERWRKFKPVGIHTLMYELQYLLGVHSGRLQEIWSIKGTTIHLCDLEMRKDNSAFVRAIDSIPGETISFGKCS